MSSDIRTIIVEDDQIGERIDTVIALTIDSLTRSAVQKLISDGNVLVNDAPVVKNYKAKSGDIVKVTIPVPVLLNAEPQDIPLDIVYEDDDLLVVNKPKGMVVHPAPGNLDGTLVNALMFHCGDSLSGINGVIRPGIVHRIDKDTSGLLIVAKNDFAHLNLAEQIKEHSFTRKYKAVVHGNIKDDEGTIDAPLGRSPKDRKKMAVTDKNSRNAVTHFTVLERFGSYTFVECKLETGRTHQIRVHMAYKGHPVAGDTVYGPKNTPKELLGQCLHAGLIGFIHPRTGEYLEFEAPLPEYFENFLKKLRDN
ncbi:MAG: RluA family pseudouridine synthase [Clostridia bacterium]|nr:RluA family pseudouridine synthase [Clostridia bacterium]